MQTDASSEYPDYTGRSIGIFGGSFNPVHNGHIELAKALVRTGIVDSVWLTLSPLNPLKAHPEELVSDSARLDMLRLATEGVPGLNVCDIELSLPRPSYTINTLRTLSEKYPDTKFRLIIGSDNMLIFDRWKDHEEIMRRFTPIVYPRPGYPYEDTVDLPVYDISSTFIRQQIRSGGTVDTLLPPEVINYIRRHGLYQEIGIYK